MNLPLIIEAEDLLPHLDNPRLRIIDLSQAQTHAQIHLPGAISVSPREVVSGEPPATGKLPSLAQLEALFSRIGYQPDQHFVVYDDEGGGWAGRFLWTLDMIGHRHASYLNGGLHTWYREGHPLTAEVTAIQPSQVSLTLHEAPRATLEQVLASLDDPSVRIWDARSAEEYHGQRQTARRNGHIPGAINLDWLELMDRERHLRLLPLDTLRAKLAERGVEAQHHIITHCQSHHRSGLSYLAAKALGFPTVRAYDGSWSEWGNHPDVPVA